MATELLITSNPTAEGDLTDNKFTTPDASKEKCKKEGEDQGSHESKLFTTGTLVGSQPEGHISSQNGDILSAENEETSLNANAVLDKPLENLNIEEDGNVDPVAESCRNSIVDLGAKYPVSEADFLPPSLLPIEHPKPEDILFGRGGLTNHHIGNRNFRDVISAHKDDYLKATKLIKPRIARSIVTSIRTGDAPGRFLKKKDGIWYDVGDKQAVEKVAQGLREKTPVQKKEIKAKTMAHLQESHQMYAPVPPYPMPPGPPVQSNSMYMNYMMPYPYNANGVMVAPFHPPHLNMIPYRFSPYKVAETLEERKEAEQYSPSKDSTKEKEAITPERKDTEHKGHGIVGDKHSHVPLGEETKKNAPIKEEDSKTRGESFESGVTDIRKSWKIEGGIFGLVDPLGNIIVSEHDILCGRGGATNHHKGNKLFRDIVALHRPDYVRAPKVQKPAVARRIVKSIRTGANPGRFLKKNSVGNWIDIGDKKAAEKASQALREKGTEDRRIGQSKKGEYFGFMAPSQGWSMPPPFYGYYPPGAMAMPQHFNPTIPVHDKLPTRPAYTPEQNNQERTDGHPRVDESKTILPKQERIPAAGSNEIIQRDTTAVAKEVKDENVSGKTYTVSVSEEEVHVAADVRNASESTSQGVLNDALVPSTPDPKDVLHSTPETVKQSINKKSTSDETLADGSEIVLKEAGQVKVEDQNEGQKRRLTSDVNHENPSPKKSRKVDT